MRLGFKITGLNAVKMQLRSIGAGVPDTARKQMHRAAARIMKRAKLYVPVDEGHLENSIRIEKSYGARGRLQIDVTAGNQMAMTAGGRVIDLNQYAWIIHERYSGMNPGDNTLDKMAKNPGVIIGEGFLTRAADEEIPALERNLVDAITMIIEGASK
jgi:hypothetical protein